MELVSITKNCNEIRVNGNRFLISYKTTVAAWIAGEAFVTEKYHSATTSKQIGKWFAESGTVRKLATPKPQEFFDKLMEEVK